MTELPEPSRWHRLRALFRRGNDTDALTSVDDERIVVVAESADEAVASSEVLGPSPWRSGRPAVLRHFLVVAVGREEDAVRIATLNGYVVGDGAAAPPGTTAVAGPPASVTLAVAKLEVFTAVDVSRERARMASLASRHQGSVLGWQVLQLPG